MMNFISTLKKTTSFTKRILDKSKKTVPDDSADNRIQVKIVIPIYKNKLTENERYSLNQCCKILASYPIVFAKPQSLDLENLSNEYPQIGVENFTDDYFADIFAYNRLMLSHEFYNRFADSVYILIYQLDAYVFRDELKEWCKKNYDYIGAPWMLKPKYRRWYFYTFLKLKQFYFFFLNRIFRPAIILNKIGNGGFSLRKISSHLRAIEKKQTKIKRYILKCKTHSEYNEDVFWATQNPEFMYPGIHEALSFSIDEYPQFCFEFNQLKIPFGCHGWSKPEYFEFWKDKITQKYE